MEKTFELLDPQTGNLKATYHNPQARAAALKAAGDGAKDIILRERNTENKERAAKLHRFKGSVQSGKWKLPLPEWKIKSETKRTGKTIPPKLNIRGGEEGLVKAGYELPTRNMPVAKKVGTYNVPKIKGADIYTSVREFLKTLPVVA